MFLAAILTVFAIIVNGATDAPNAISTAVASGSLSYRKAVIIAGICNFGGVVVMWSISPKVAENMSQLLDICGKENIWITLIASFSSIIIFATISWYFGIPTSESHGLVGGILGCALGFGKITKENLIIVYPVALGLIISVVLGFLFGFIFFVMLKKIFKAKHSKFIRIGQIISCALIAFMHGAQDGLKFSGLIIALTYAADKEFSQKSAIIICSVTMMIGTFIGGKRIIENLTNKMVKIDLLGGICADLGCAAALWICSIYGMPVSTTHTKTCAMVGSGYGAGKYIDKNTIKSIFMAWVITFPVCGGISYVIIRLILR